MRYPRGEEPDVAFADVVDVGAPVRVEGCYARAPLEDKGPLGGCVPVEFAVGVGLETHVDACHGFGDGQHVLVLLARPAGVVADAGAVVGETHVEHELGGAAGVGAGGRV